MVAVFEIQAQDQISIAAPYRDAWYTFNSISATLDAGTETVSSAMRRAVYRFPPLTSQENTRVVQENERVDGSCWENAIVMPAGDTLWLSDVTLGDPYGGTVKWLYNADEGFTVGGGGGGDGEGGGGGGGGGGSVWQVCYYEVWIDEFGYINWDNAIPLGCEYVE